MRTQINTIAWMHIVLGSLNILGGIGAGLFFAVIGGAAATAGREALPFALSMNLIGLIVFFVVAVLGVPGVILGWGLLKNMEWARIMGIVVSLLNILNFPLGTLLGVYGLWVFFNPETLAIFEGYRKQRYF